MPPPKRAAKAGPKSVKEKRAKKEPESYEVEHILGIKYDLDSKGIQYLVKWDGWAIKSNSWEGEDNVTSDDLTDPYDGAYQFLKSKFISKDNGYPSDTDDETEDERRAARKLKGHWDVEALMGVQLDCKKNQIQYLVKWEDWDNSYNSWEPQQHLSNCPIKKKNFAESVQELERRRDDLRAVLPKEAEVSSDEEVDENEAKNTKSPKKKPGPKSANKKKKAGPASRTSRVNGGGDAAPSPKKRAGPKSRTSAPVSAKKRAGPRSRTEKVADAEVDEAAANTDVEDEDAEVTSPPPKKRAGPKSRTKK